MDESMLPADPADLTPEQIAWLQRQAVAQAAAAAAEPPPLGDRLATVEASVEQLDAIIVAVLS